MGGKAECQSGHHILRTLSGHRMVTNCAETVSLYVRPDMDILYRAHVDALFRTGRYVEALT